MMNNWVIFQVGARENYLISETLEKENRLCRLVTDIWMDPNLNSSKILQKFVPRISTRFNNHIPRHKVRSFNLLFFFILLLNKVLPSRISINYGIICQYYFSYALWIEKRKSKSPLIIFSYNYSAYHVFRSAKRYGFKTILGQIDAGPEAGKINRDLYYNIFGNNIKPHDYYLTYGGKWKKENLWADKIIVNSEWSKKLLKKVGVDERKLTVVNLAYAPPKEAYGFQRSYPKEFDANRPLKVLFLGSLKIMKGFLPLMEAARRLVNFPVEFVSVGSLKMPPFLLNDAPPNMLILNGVPKTDTIKYYKEADVFILPTYSDGFAITQLEAQAWKLPIITTPFCGKVVEHGKNGWIMGAVDSGAIERIILNIIDSPEVLRKYSQNSLTFGAFSPDALKKSLFKIENQITDK